MLEHDTFDLEAAFRAFEQDLADISRPRGAGVAVAAATARRRRRVCAVAAAAVLAVGGAAVGHTWGGQSDVSPAGRSVPDPAALDPGTLSAATAGWTAAWHEVPATVKTPELTLIPSCTASRVLDSASTVAGSTGLLETDDGHFAQWGALRYDNGAQAQASRLHDAINACPGVETVADHIYADGTHASLVTLPALDGGTTEYAFASNKDLMLQLQLAPASGAPTAVQDRLADALAGALRAYSEASS